MNEKTKRKITFAKAVLRAAVKSCGHDQVRKLVQVITLIDDLVDLQQQVAGECKELRDSESELRGLLLDALQKLGPAETEREPMNEDELLADAIKMANKAEGKFGPHPSADFAACRVAEEAGELVAAATSMTNGRAENRAERIREEAIDTIAMVIRLMREFPNGR